MLFFVIVVVAGAAVTIGITLRRKKNVSQRDAVQETVSEKK